MPSMSASRTASCLVHGLAPEQRRSRECQSPLKPPDPDQADPALLHDHSRLAGAAAGFQPGVAAAESRVTGEGKLARRREDPQLVVRVGSGRLEHERCFRQVRPVGEPLHFLRAQTVAIQHDSDRIAAVGHRGEDIDLTELANHETGFLCFSNGLRRQSMARLYASVTPSKTGSMLNSTRSSLRSAEFSARSESVSGSLMPGRATLPIPEDVVDDHQSAWPEQFEASLEVEGIVFLVGVDEGEVHGAGRAVGQQRVQGLGRGAYLELDAVGDAGPFPERASDVGPLLAEVAGDDAAARREARGPWPACCTR